MAIARVSEVRASSLAVITSLATPAFNLVAGNTVVFAVRHDLGVGVTLTVTDTAGNTYTQINEASLGAVDRIRLYYARNCLGHPTNIVTLTASGNIQYTALLAVQYSGLAAAPLDANAVGNGASSTTATSGAFTTSHADELLVSAASFEATGNTFTTAGGWSIVIQDADGMMGFAEKLVSSIQTGVTATQSVAGAANWEICAATFTEAPAFHATERGAGRISQDLYNNSLAITPSDTVDHAWVFDAFLVGGAGDVVLVQENNAPVTLTGLLAGYVYNIRGRRVNATSTTATGLTALRYD